MARPGNMPKYTLDGFLTGCVNFAGAFVTLLVFAVLALVIAAIAGGICQVIWPSGTYTVDKNIVDLARVLAWPLVAGIAFFFFATSKALQGGARSIFQRVSKLKAGSYEVSFTEQGAKQLKRDVEQSIADFATQSAIECQRSARTHRVRDALTNTVEQICRVSKTTSNPNAEGLKKKNLSATVHMTDVLYEDSLYQLVDYVPAGGGSGRRFSTRYGAIGTALRSGKATIWNIRDPEKSQERLVTHYGMTPNEAVHADEVEYAMAIPLTDTKGTTPGVFFLKASKLTSVTALVGPDPQDDTATQTRKIQAQNDNLQALLTALEGDTAFESSMVSLADAVASAFEDVSPSGTFIRVYN